MSQRSSDLFNTFLPVGKELMFQLWKQKYAPKDSGFDYDFRGAYQEGLTPGPDAHWADTHKKPNHPSYSNQSKYFLNNQQGAGFWIGNDWMPINPGGQ
jgi:hypothetical protein